AERVDVDIRVRSQRTGDHGALWMHLGFLRRELAALHQLVDERVILSELLDPALADEVRAGVADVSERDAIVLGERNGDRRTHARGVRIGARPVVDATVRLLDQVEDPILPAAADRALAEGRSCEARRDLTRL